MIKLFRKVRQNLINGSKTFSYLKYAVGEIILVVIGILLALQINNRNEQSKIEKSIDNHLLILKQNLQEDQTLLKALKTTMTENYNMSDSLMMQLKTLIPVDEKTSKFLIKLLLEYQFRPNTNAIETISQSNEIPFLKTEIRTAILDYYALIQSAKEREHISNTQIQTKYEVYLNNHYSMVFQKNNQWEFIKDYYKDDPRPIITLDAASFLADKQLEALITSRYFQSKELLKFYGQLYEESEHILQLIDARFTKK